MPPYSYYGSPYSYPQQQTYPTYPYQQQGVQPTPPAPPQMQNGGFVSVPSIADAQRYAVAPGNAVTFKIEGQPIVCEKSQGFSQLETPRFEVFDLVKRTMPVAPQEAHIGAENAQAQNVSNFVLKEEIEPLKQEFETLKSEVITLKEQIHKKDEKDGDE